MMASGPEVMLASSSSSDIPTNIIARLQREQWFFEIKFDGIRAVVSRDAAGEVRIFNRRRVDITHRYPDVVSQFSAATWTGLVDGEIVVPDERGRPNFALAHRRDAQSSESGVRAAMAKAPAMFMPFDVLRENEFDLRGFPYVERRMRLAAMFPTGAISNANLDGATMWKFVQENELEGLVAKRPDSAYRKGRQKAWVKIKSTHRISALVCGIVPSKGSRVTPFGSLRLCLWDPVARELVRIGNVGSGLSDQDVRDLSTLLEAKQSIVVEVEYLEVAPSGQLRMPVYRGVRTDVLPQMCTLSTLPIRTSSRSAAV